MMYVHRIKEPRYYTFCVCILCIFISYDAAFSNTYQTVYEKKYISYIRYKKYAIHKSISKIFRMDAGTWTIVQFLEDGTVEATPTMWIRDDICYWPTLPQNRLMDAIKRLDPVDASWPKHKIKVFRNSTYEDYTEALCKAKEATEENNDLQSENEALQKRNRKQKRFSSSDDDSLNYVNCLLPTPSRRKKQKNIELCTPLNHDADEDKHNVLVKIENDSSPTHDFATENENTNSYRNCQETDRYLRTIIEQNHLLQGLVSHVLNEIKILKNDLKGTNSAPQKQSLFTKYDEVKFPLNSEEDIEIFEKILSNQEDFEDGVNELSKVGGSNTYQFVKRVLMSLMTNDLALKYSWLGRKGKKEFYNLRTASLVICAAEKANIAENRRQSEISIQQWLKRASDRKGTVNNF